MRMTPVRELPARRRRLRMVVVGAVAGAVALSGCSGSDKKPKTAAKTSTTPTATRTVPAFRAKGLPAGLLAAVRPLYLGGSVPASTGAARALAHRKVTPGTRVSVVGSLGTWKGTPIAVVTSGKDVTLAVAAPRWKVVGGWWPSLGVAKPSLGTAPRRVLFIGTDARPGENPLKARGDSLHIVGYDGKGKGGIVGIPRDSYVPLATGGRGKINSALMLGGPAAQTRTVTSYTGVPVEGYVVTGFQGFIRLVNSTGGVRVYSPRAFHDTYSRAVVKKGLNFLYGRQALAYARSRHAQPNGDFDRSRNQGTLMLAGDTLVKMRGPAGLPKLLRGASPNVSTNLSAEQVLTFAAFTYVTPLSAIHNKVATGGFGMTSDGQSIVELGSYAHSLFADMRDGSLR